MSENDDILIPDKNTKVYTVRCAGRPVRNYRTEKEAKGMRDAIIDEPELFVQIQAWEPGEFYPYVKFD